jgi:streptogramin lyase
MQTKWLAIALTLGLVLFTGSSTPLAADCNCENKTYTLDADFDEGTLVNVNHDAPNNDQLQLNSQGEPFNFIWVAASGLGTIVKIDTITGAVLGEYLSAPDGRGRNPSRTTVDSNGNVWAGNRNEASGGQGSVVRIGLLENGQCVDRNGNGVIDTSTGLGDVRSWSNTGAADDNGGVSTADDECIINYVRTAGTNVRTVAVDGTNDVWVGGYGNRVHEKIDGLTGASVVGTQFNLGCGGYGGLVDGNGILWSASFSASLLRYDTNTLTGSCISLGRNSYGLGIDTNGFIWNSNWSFNTILKIDPSGAPILGPFSTGGASNDRGVTVTAADNNVWVANSGGSDISRLDNSGVFQAVIGVGITPTGVAVDAAGKVWVTNFTSDNVMRIDPATNAVDLTVPLRPGSSPYNYSDMTGSTLIAPPETGTWAVIYDSECEGHEWATVNVSWNSDEPDDSSITVEVSSSDDGVIFGPAEVVASGDPLTVGDGRYLKVVVTFERSTAGGSPILYDLTIDCNQPPDCSDAAASINTIWPPNHKFVDISVIGVTDPDGDPITITVDAISQDEPVDTFGDGSFTPDGQGVGTDTAEVRAERSGTKKVPGNGRMYHIEFTANDDNGAECVGEVLVGVPHDQGQGSFPIDDGPFYDSTELSP